MLYVDDADKTEEHVKKLLRGAGNAFCLLRKTNPKEYEKRCNETNEQHEEEKGSTKLNEEKRESERIKTNKKKKRRLNFAIEVGIFSYIAVGGLLFYMLTQPQKQYKPPAVNGGYVSVIYPHSKRITSVMDNMSVSSTRCVSSSIQSNFTVKVKKDNGQEGYLWVQNAVVIKCGNNKLKLSNESETFNTSDYNKSIKNIPLKGEGSTYCVVPDIFGGCPPKGVTYKHLKYSYLKKLPPISGHLTNNQSTSNRRWKVNETSMTTINLNKNGKVCLHFYAKDNIRAKNKFKLFDVVCTKNKYKDAYIISDYKDPLQLGVLGYANGEHAIFPQGTQAKLKILVKDQNGKWTTPYYTSGVYNESAESSNLIPNFHTKSGNISLKVE